MPSNLMNEEEIYMLIGLKRLELKFDTQHDNEPH